MREVVQLGNRGTRWERFRTSWRRVMLFVGGLVLIVQGLIALVGWAEPFVPLKVPLPHRPFWWGSFVGGAISLTVGAAGIYFAVKGRRDSD